jgi:hypothetical protein
MQSRNFTFIMATTFVLSLLISLPANAQYRNQEVRKTTQSGWFSSWRWPWQSAPVNNDRLMNPGYAHPTINGPIQPSVTSNFMQLRNKLYATGAAPVVVQPQYRQPQTHSFGAWAVQGAARMGTAVAQIPGALMQWASWAYNWTAEQLSRFNQVIDKYVFARRGKGCQAIIGRNGQPVPSDGRSQGCCKGAVNDMLVEMGLTANRVPGNSATQMAALGNLRNSRGELLFRDVSNEIGRNSYLAPVGAVLVYNGGPHGHVEVRKPNGEFCSDYCSVRPRDVYSFGSRRLSQVFVRTNAVLP